MSVPNKRLSDTLRRQYQSGEKKVPVSARRGKPSYITKQGRTFLLRSTYEFIFAIFLHTVDHEFMYEDVRVEYKNKGSISDFRIGPLIVEIKGRVQGSFGSYTGRGIKRIIKAFESSNWKIIAIGPDVIDSIRKFLVVIGYPIDQWLTLIYEGVSKKNYFHCYLDKVKGTKVKIFELPKDLNMLSQHLGENLVNLECGSGIMR